MSAVRIRRRTPRHLANQTLNSGGIGNIAGEGGSVDLVARNSVLFNRRPGKPAGSHIDQTIVIRLALPPAAAVLVETEHSSSIRFRSQSSPAVIA